MIFNSLGLMGQSTSWKINRILKCQSSSWLEQSCSSLTSLGTRSQARQPAGLLDLLMLFIDDLLDSRLKFPWRRPFLINKASHRASFILWKAIRYKQFADDTLDIELACDP
ncbi:uncharacterized protein LOC130825617 [Amaranthus tricolor]|uniref:uncharacterized protein LOC130825617 n=1 Tax=Amaranthus tricolor TaxID=29722 RepID=UPI002583676B|nr:uncharacterized protein LOC130825617 [Amaranthus tricolor]